MQTQQKSLKLVQQHILSLGEVEGGKLLEHINRINLATKINTDPQFLEECVTELVDQYPFLNEIFCVR